MPALALVLSALQGIEQLVVSLPGVVAVVQQLRSTVQTLKDENRDPTQEEWDAINAQIDAVLADLNKD